MKNGFLRRNRTMEGHDTSDSVNGFDDEFIEYPALSHHSSEELPGGHSEARRPPKLIFWTFVLTSRPSMFRDFGSSGHSGEFGGNEFENKILRNEQVRTYAFLLTVFSIPNVTSLCVR